MTIRIGTRASALARWQAEWVAAQLRQRGNEVELVLITTAGDRKRGPIEETEGRGLFTKEIQLALLDGRADLAVHSMKDLPTAPAQGLLLAAVPERGPAGDALVANSAKSLETLPQGTTVGTGSIRRSAQLRHFRPDLQVKAIRGNVDTRVRKLREGGYDALLLAEAGLRRLGLANEIAQTVPLDVMLPAPGQGAMAIETRADDARSRESVRPLDHPATHAAVRAERAMLTALEGGCLAPVAALGRVDGGRLTLRGRVIGHDGVELLEACQEAPVADAELLGRLVAQTLLAQGAGELIQAARDLT
ncbi:MAG: hydroxymethylbilane synthase [Planctomycetaceae bacterium]|nr:hydroxymethylbilane synthase [Planctomycetaceae bacterium]